jgi:hypothetical protein
MGEDILRLVLDEAIGWVRLDRKAASALVADDAGNRRDGQKVLPTVHVMGADSGAACRAMPDGPMTRAALRPSWPDAPKSP